LYFEAIKKLAEERGFTIKSLEAEAGVGNGTVGKWQLYGNKPQLETLEKFSKVLGVSVSEIVKLAEDSKT